LCLSIYAVTQLNDRSGDDGESSIVGIAGSPDLGGPLPQEAIKKASAIVFGRIEVVDGVMRTRYERPLWVRDDITLSFEKGEAIESLVDVAADGQHDSEILFYFRDTKTPAVVWRVYGKYIPEYPEMSLLEFEGFLSSK
jgi:hypothetical protein